VTWSFLSSQSIERKLSNWTILYYGIGQQAEGMKDAAFKVFLLFYYQQIVGVSGTLTGLALAIALCVDGVTDPIAGSISDRANTRFGRRHPFIVGSSIPLAVTFYLLFNPPEALSELGNFLWLATFAVLVRITLTLYNIPHLALGAELTSNSVQRATLFNASALLRLSGGAMVSMFGYILFFRTTEEFSPGLLNKDSYSPFSIFFGVWMVINIVVSALGTYSEVPHMKKIPINPERNWLSGFGEIKHAFGNLAFRSVFFYSFIIALISSIGGVFAPFVGFHFWEFSTENVAFLILFGAPGVFSSLIVVRWLASRFDKKQIVIGSSLALILISNWAIVARLSGADWFPDNSSNYVLAIACMNTFFGALIGTVLITTGDSMLADITDEIDLETGSRREGVIFSARTFMFKATGSLGLMLGGIGLDLISFPSNATTGTVPAAVVWQLGLLSGPVPGFFTIFAFLLLLNYPLSRKRQAEIQVALNIRDKGV
jgi:GPH family glycoside/pentoside/hexuronide:cation symporter